VQYSFDNMPFLMFLRFWLENAYLHSVIWGFDSLKKPQRAHPCAEIRHNDVYVVKIGPTVRLERVMMKIRNNQRKKPQAYSGKLEWKVFDSCTIYAYALIGREQSRYHAQ